MKVYSFSWVRSTRLSFQLCLCTRGMQASVQRSKLLALSLCKTETKVTQIFYTSTINKHNSWTRICCKTILRFDSDICW